jgi:hypothetical protein
MTLQTRATLTAAAVAMLSIGVLATAAVQAQAAATYGVNLVVNGGAEADVGAPDASHVVKPTGWITTGQFTPVQYGAPGGFPDKTSPGPSDRGKNDFEGGNAPQSTAKQTISLASEAADIRTGAVHYVLSAWLGGYASQDDNAIVTLSFRDAHGASLGTVSLGPVTPAQRSSVTGLLRRANSGVVPKGASAAVVTIVLTRVDGEYNDGAADDVSLVLKKG